MLHCSIGFVASSHSRRSILHSCSTLTSGLSVSGHSRRSVLHLCGSCVSFLDALFPISLRQFFFSARRARGRGCPRAGPANPMKKDPACAPRAQGLAGLWLSGCTQPPGFLDTAPRGSLGAGHGSVRRCQGFAVRGMPNDAIRSRVRPLAVRRPTMFSWCT